MATVSMSTTPMSTNDPDSDSPDRRALIRIEPPGTLIRHPPPPHELTTFVTPDTHLFQTIHMGPALIDLHLYRLHITGLVSHPLTLTLSSLQSLPSTTLTSFHECYGPPTAKPTKNYWRIGNVTWTGVRLSTLLTHADILPLAKYIWSDGLDHGTFAGYTSRKYQKDLTIAKAMRDECLIAYAMNGEPLTMKRGGPVRLIVPGWFGTNSTKWLCKLDVRDKRAEETIFTTKFYNEIDPTDEKGQRIRPVWEVEVNSCISRPKPDEGLDSSNAVCVEGWAWSCDGVQSVQVGLQAVGEETKWENAIVDTRNDDRWNWQKFNWQGTLNPGDYTATARATCKSGQSQPIAGRRNHVHSVSFKVV